MLTETWKIKGKDRDTEKNIEKEAEGWRDTNRDRHGGTLRHGQGESWTPRDLEKGGQAGQES